MFHVQFLVVSALHEMPPEGIGTRMGARLLAARLPLPVLSDVPSRRPDIRPSTTSASGVGRHLQHHGTGRGARRTAVRHSRPMHSR